MAVVPRCPYACRKLFLAPPRPIETLDSAKREVPKPAFQQMLRRQPRDLRIVRFDPRQCRHQPRRAQVHRRQAGLHDRRRDPRRLDARDDPVALPALQPRRRIVAPPLLHQVKRPRLMLPDVVHHALQQPARIGVRGLDQQRHFTAARGTDRRHNQQRCRSSQKINPPPVPSLPQGIRSEKTQSFCANSHGANVPTCYY